MLQVSRWVKILVSLILLGGILIALPNVLPEQLRAKIPSWAPHDTLALGLDLQGGSYILLEVELDQVMKDRLDSTVGDIRRSLAQGPYRIHRSCSIARHGFGSHSRTKPIRRRRCGDQGSESDTGHKCLCGRRASIRSQPAG